MSNLNKPYLHKLARIVRVGSGLGYTKFSKRIHQHFANSPDPIVLMSDHCTVLIARPLQNATTGKLMYWYLLNSPTEWVDLSPINIFRNGALIDPTKHHPLRSIFSLIQGGRVVAI